MARSWKREMTAVFIGEHGWTIERVIAVLKSQGASFEAHGRVPGDDI